MNKIIPFPRPFRVHEEACNWLARLDAGATEQDREEFALWITEDPVHLKVLVEVASMWDQLGILDELSEIFPLNTYSPVQNKSSGRRKLLSATAFLFGLLVVGGLALVSGDALRTSSSYATAVGEQLTIELPDDSTVTLNTNTYLSVIYSNGERKINLEKGEALFTVEKDASRPFRVYVGSRVVEAIGTAFTVHRNPRNDVEVMVTEGMVNVIKLPEVSESTDKKIARPEEVAAVSLSAGEFAAAIGETSDEIEVRIMEESEVEARLAWREGMLLFEGNPLEEVLREVSRYTLARLEAEPSIRNIPVYGYFRVGDIAGLVSTMRQNFNVDARKFGEEYILFVPQITSDQEKEE